jgi:hypothetical protein
MARLPFRERREIARHELGRGSSPDPLKIFSTVAAAIAIVFVLELRNKA